MKRTTSIITAGITAAAVAAVLGTGTAHAATTGGPGNNTVMAQVQVGTSLTVTGISGTVDFGTMNVGQTSTVPGAEKYEVVTNSPGGFTATLGEPTGAWAAWTNTSTSQMSTLPVTALSVKNNAGNTVTAPMPSAGPVPLEAGPAGDTHLSEDWSLAVPSSFTESGSFAYGYVLSVQPAA